MERTNLEDMSYTFDQTRYQPDDETARIIDRKNKERRNARINRLIYRTLVVLGNLLVAWGSRLQSYQEAVVNPNTEGKPSTC